ncbi:MAG: hypothetical protein LDL30_06705, partial [Desulfovibrio sp.]|nr:hypothetical protein [Desulfovibrio sp.]
RIMQELGEATGDRGLQRAGLLADITAQAEALTLLAKSAEEFDLIQRQATLKAAQTRRDTAEDFAEYWRVSMDELGAISKAAGDQEQAIWGEVLQEWLTNSATMAAAREAAYGRVIEAAQAAGDAELAVMAQVARESAALERLQAIQQYGDPTAAFLARLSEGLREYQSEATKAREAAVQLADGLLQLKADAESALGQFAGDWVYGFLTGTATVEDAWENMLDNMARAFSDWVASLTTDWTKDILDMGLSLLKGGLSGLFNSHSPNISALINAPIVAKAKGDVMGAPGLSAYRNRIVSSPTFFPFATGIGLMGEAGPEAIMPLLGAAGAHRVRAVLPNGREDAVDLTRTASGHLGVQLPAWLANVQPCAEGWAPRVLSPSHTPLAPLAPLPDVQAGVRSGAQSGGSVKGGDGAAAPVMHVTVHNNAGADVSVQQSADGMNFDILVEKVAHGIAGQARRGKGPFAGRL